MATMQDVTKLLRDLRPKINEVHALACEDYATVYYEGTLAERTRRFFPEREVTEKEETTFLFRMRHSRFGSARTRIWLSPDLLFDCKDWWRLCREMADENFRQCLAEHREETENGCQNGSKLGK